MGRVLIYSSSYCPYCIRALQLLQSKRAECGIEVEVISVDGRPELRQEMAHKAGRTSVPQIWIGDQHIGGCDELYALERQGALDSLLAA
ncbi:glutaredoxin 3 [Aestuariirhabdus litorea]|uniref:Glutaredoxin n=1 Tax=Aestuariirhabdus litorea TaxID=2528527 RepID=A0A3P3VL97_9GAMM|nr:glutaredoxin 3 [Aestuariirhabdus litorea]RRJ83107.1 glutaredoxin 3 [Aestuariirhabdus litorea]RWW93264.1 glutaredoxin 3 [Endozoicomonadaceae bacterium GTF-13]